MLNIQALNAIGEVRPGDDLAALLAAALRAAGADLQAFDILVVTQKIVSKAEGRFVDLAGVAPGAEARRLAEVTRKDPRLVELVLAESSAVIRSVPHVLITRHRSGHVMANAGIDQSNIGSAGGDLALLLPVDADASARRLREALESLWPAGFGVLVSDSFGRPWRYGVTNVAIGASGFPALIDRRGTRDRDGRVLEVTQVALGDMAASAAGLVTGEGAEGVPAALIRGLSWDVTANPASALIRPVTEDLFR
ncbi:MAG: coenzyme F420-0:L-glutamate ligase [Sphingomonas bacterium]|uniref:coenzyme F420-0:L-glutamate ligase n=1 Tax=Sphingomonas bacterium TaxID=1895847 RepID=UPI002602CE0B|nr:coenzyme F420-0:L-glutamate ligase [Sphingomonas bacterium]MDB5706602.1 coenzyme F420-0:L-glutamate ligase [Sphingomonas bacterium]